MNKEPTLFTVHLRFCFTVKWGTDLRLVAPAPCVHFPSKSSARQMLLLNLGTQTHFPALSLHGTCNSLASCSHISILEAESKCISCSWVNYHIQVCSPAETIHYELVSGKQYILMSGQPIF